MFHNFLYIFLAINLIGIGARPVEEQIADIQQEWDLHIKILEELRPDQTSEEKIIILQKSYDACDRAAKKCKALMEDYKPTIITQFLAGRDHYRFQAICKNAKDHKKIIEEERFAIELVINKLALPLCFQKADQLLSNLNHFGKKVSADYTSIIGKYSEAQSRAALLGAVDLQQQALQLKNFYTEEQKNRSEFLSQEKKALAVLQQTWEDRQQIGEIFFSSKEVLEKKSIHFEDVGQDPYLDRLADKIGCNPIHIARYVQNEIHDVSETENCRILVYLLKKAGFDARFAMSEDHVWVILNLQNEQIHLYPWIKQYTFEEGVSLYENLPENFNTASLWVRQYLLKDESIFCHAQQDYNDTAAVLFERYVKSKVPDQIVGRKRIPLKVNYEFFEDFPKPDEWLIPDQIVLELNDARKIFVTIHSQTNPKKSIKLLLDSQIPFFFEQIQEKKRLHVGKETIDLDNDEQMFEVHILDKCLYFDDKTQGVISLHCNHVTASCDAYKYHNEQDADKKIFSLLGYVGSKYFEMCREGRSTLANLHNIDDQLDFAAGMTKLHNDHFEIDMLWFNQRTPANLDEHQFEVLCAADASSKEHYVIEEVFNDPGAVSAVRLLQNDAAVVYFNHEIFQWADAHPIAAQEYFYPKSNLKYLQTKAKGQWDILRQTFSSAEGKTATAYMTSKPKDGFTATLILAQGKNRSLISYDGIVLNGGCGSEYNYHQPAIPFSPPPVAVSDYNFSCFGYSIDLDFMHIGSSFSFNQQNLFSMDHPLFNNGIYSTNGSRIAGYCGMEHTSDYSTFKHQMESFPPFYASAQGGGYTQDNSYLSVSWSPLEPNFYSSTPYSFPSQSFYNTSLPNLNYQKMDQSYFQNNICNQADFTRCAAFEELDLNPQMVESDVRNDFTPEISLVADPVDIVSGAFYIDELDLKINGPFPLTIGRNYNTQNSIPREFGYGWKLSLCPYRSECDGKIYIAEPDGTWIVYAKDTQGDRLVVHKEDNPALFNFSNDSIGGSANPYASYIKNDTLYSADGSTRVFEGNKLVEWHDGKGNTLFFWYYDNDLLYRIDSSNGDFCHFEYNLDGLITETYTSDGRRTRYYYSLSKDLIKIILPNDATIEYVYDDCHRIIRELRPHGRFLENVYDAKSRVIEQRAFNEVTKFAYYPNETVVTDPNGSTTSHKIYGNKIYKVTDPSGNSSYYCWFTGLNSWFDPIEEKVFEDSSVFGGYGGLKYEIDKRGKKTSYTYDDRGNPIEVDVDGKITKRVFNEKNLCVQLDDIVMTYDERFSYLPKRVDFADRYFEYTYDDHGQVILENDSGKRVAFAYDHNNILKTEYTGTDDPDVVTLYTYDTAGNCILLISCTCTRKKIYDVMGNLLVDRVYDSANQLVAENRYTYDLNNELILESADNFKSNIVYKRFPNGKIKTLQSENKTTHFTYDPLGNLIQEIDSDGNCIIREYDDLGHLIGESKNGVKITIEREVGGLVQKIIKPSGGELKETISPSVLTPEIKKTYDDLGRIKTATNLKGETTRWFYQGNTTTKWLPSGEVETQVTGPLNEIVITIKTSDGRVIYRNVVYPEKEDDEPFIDPSCHYDHFSRLVKKDLGDGSCIEYTYDDDSNLIRYDLPNGISWTATYDAQGNKLTQTLLNETWSYTYQDDRLVMKEDPLKRKYIYSYDDLGRLIREDVGRWHRVYTYDSYNRITTLEQYYDGGDHTLVTRAYDAAGKLVDEKVFLNGELHQYSIQEHTPSTRTLKTNGHVCRFTYELDRIVKVEVQQDTFEYTFSEDGLLLTKKNQAVTSTFSYDSCSRAIQVDHEMPNTVDEEIIRWDPSSKIIYHATPQKEGRFYYNELDQLIEAGDQKFAYTNTNTITAIHQNVVDPEGINQNGQVCRQHDPNGPIITTYDPLGQVRTQYSNIFEYDPWGRLIRMDVMHDTFEALYDGFGRRIQTCYKNKKTKSYFDPEHEYREIGISYDEKLYWKVYGPSGCDAVIQNNDCIYLVQTIHQHLYALVKNNRVEYIEAPTPYGRLTSPPEVPKNLHDYAKSLAWRGLAHDPTGYIWIGARMYDP